MAIVAMWRRLYQALFAILLAVFSSAHSTAREQKQPRKCRPIHVVPHLTRLCEQMPPYIILASDEPSKSELMSSVQG